MRGRSETTGRTPRSRHDREARSLGASVPKKSSVGSQFPLPRREGLGEGFPTPPFRFVMKRVRPRESPLLLKRTVIRDGKPLLHSVLRLGRLAAFNLSA